MAALCDAVDREGALAVYKQLVLSNSVVAGRPRTAVTLSVVRIVATLLPSALTLRAGLVPQPAASSQQPPPVCGVFALASFVRKGKQHAERQSDADVVSATIGNGARLSGL